MDFHGSTVPDKGNKTTIKSSAKYKKENLVFRTIKHLYSCHDKSTKIAYTEIKIGRL